MVSTHPHSLTTTRFLYFLATFGSLLSATSASPRLPLESTPLSKRSDQQRTYLLGQSFEKASLKQILEKDQARAVALGRVQASGANAVVDPGFDLSNGTVSLQAAFASFAANSQPAVLNTDISIDNAISAYYVDVKVGTPSQNIQMMLIDTGSAITWIRTPDVKYIGRAPQTYTGYDPSLSSSVVDTGFGVNMTYGIGSFDGNALTETFEFPGENNVLTITDQTFGSAFSLDFDNRFDGLIGLSPAVQGDTSLYVKSTGNHFRQNVPTVADNLFNQGQIPSNVVALSFKPVTSTDQPTLRGSGTMTFGGPNQDDYNGEIKYFPRNLDPFVSDYWGLQVDSVTFETLDATTSLYTPLPLLPTPALGIVDSGTTFMALPDAMYKAYMASLPGAFTFQGFLLIPNSQVARMGNMTFNMQGSEFILSPSGQLLPIEIQRAFTGTTPQQIGFHVAIFNNFGLGGGTGEFTFSMYWMERFYTIFDTSNDRIGFAYTDYTFEKTTESAAFRRAKRAHREHTKRHAWMGGKARVEQLMRRRS